MKHRKLIQRIWTSVATVALVLTAFHYFSESQSAALLNTILALDLVLFAIAMPTAVFGIAVAVAGYFVLEIDPRAVEGAYLNTVFLSVLGTVQWFWLTRFYFPPEAPFQELHIAS